MMTEHILQRKPRPTLTPALKPAPAPKTTAPLVHHATASGGSALDTKTQREMGSRFGHDFSQVRIHTDTRAAESAQAMSANAYAVGSSIVFGEGRYAPGTRDGDRLLAHELTHVVQQSQLGGGDWGRPSQRGDASEQEAETLAALVLAGQTVRVHCAPGAMIARYPPDGDGPAIGPYIPPDQTDTNPNSPYAQGVYNAGGSLFNDAVGFIPGAGNVYSAIQADADLDRANDPKATEKERTAAGHDAMIDGAGAIPVVGNVLGAGRFGWDAGAAALRTVGANPDYAPTSGEAFNDLMNLF